MTTNYLPEKRECFKGAAMQFFENVEDVKPEKVAQEISPLGRKLSDNSENWPVEIEQLIIEELPSAANSRINVSIDERDDINGKAKGRIVVGGEFIIPLFVDKFQISPFDVLIHKGKPHAATRRKIVELLTTQALSKRLASKKEMRAAQASGSKVSPLNQMGSMAPDSNFGGGKLASDFNYAIEMDQQGQIHVDYFDRFSEKKSSTSFHKLASADFFKSVGLDPASVVEDLEKGPVCLSYSEPFASVEQVKTAEDSNTGLVTESGAYRAYKMWSGDPVDGVFIPKVASLPGLEDRGSVFFSSEGYAVEDFIGSPAPVDEVGIQKLASEQIEKGARGYLVFGKELGIGPIEFKSGAATDIGSTRFKVAGDRGAELDIYFKKGSTKVAFDLENSKIVFPENTVFYPAEKKVQLCKRADHLQKIAVSKSTVDIVKDGPNVKVSYKESGKQTEKRFKTRNELWNWFLTQGLTNQAAKSLSKTITDRKKYSFLGKIIEKQTGKKIQRDGSAVFSGPDLESKTPREQIDIPKEAQEKFNDGFEKNSALSLYVTALVNERNMPGRYFKKLAGETALLARMAVSEMSDFPSLKKIAKDLDPLQEEDRVQHYLDLIPKLEDLETNMAAMLLDLRTSKHDSEGLSDSGLSSLPENTLCSLVKKLGHIKDSLIVISKLL